MLEIPVQFLGQEDPLEKVYATHSSLLGLPLCGSAGKESACNAGDPSSIPGLGRSLGERKGYPFQDSWVSLVAQTVKNLPAIQETWVQSLSREDPLEEGMATQSSILAWRIPMDRRAWWAIVQGVTKSMDTTEQISLHFTSTI